jgi:hypothetical protein
MIEVTGFSWKGPVPPPALPGIEQEAAFELVPDGQTARSLRASASMAVADAQDSERGNVLSVRTAGLVRTGELKLLEGSWPSAVFDPEVHPYLSFWIRPQRAEPMEVAIHPASKPMQSVGLFGDWPLPSEFGQAPAGHQQLRVVNGDAWQQVVIDLRMLETGPISAISLRTSPRVGFWLPDQALPPVVLLDDIKVTRTAPAPVTAFETDPVVTPDPASANKSARALFAAQATDATDKAAPEPSSGSSIRRPR